MIIAYTATKLHLVARMPGIDIPWTTPPILNAFLSSGGKVSVVVCQVVVILVSALIYYPFFKFIDTKALMEESRQDNQ